MSDDPSQLRNIQPELVRSVLTSPAIAPPMTHRERRASRPAIPVHDHVAGMAHLCQKLGYHFNTVSFLDVAMTHPSWRNENAPGQADNQRFEFLGDAVLGLVITQELVVRLPQRREGELTVLKSQLVRESSLAIVAESLQIGLALKLGRGEDQTGGRQRASVLADALEAILGAVFLDSGYDCTRQLIVRLFSTMIDEVIAHVETIPPNPTALSAGTANWKTAVQELLQQLGFVPPTYQLIGEDGPVHTRRFHVRVVAQIGSQEHSAEGVGPSKKLAENEAASGLYLQVEQLLTAHNAGTKVELGNLELGDVELGNKEENAVP